MLCPNCGTDVGDHAALCPSCAAKASSGGGGTNLGAIRPNVRVVHLKPGEELPEHLRPSGYQPRSEEAERRDSPQQERPERSQPPQQEPRQQAPHQPRAYQQEGFVQNNFEQHHPPDHRTETAPPRKEPEFARYAGFFLIIAAAWALVVLLRSTGSSPLVEFRHEPSEQPSFSHIVIHEKKEVIVDGTKVIGRFQLEDTLVALSSVKAKWSQSKNSLELQYTAPPDQEGVESKPGEPTLVVWLQFGKLQGRLDREKLQSYMIEYRGGKEPLRIVKSYSTQLAAFGEVSPLTGNLKPGEKLRGSLRDARSEERDGKVLHLNWELTFDTPAEIIR